MDQFVTFRKRLYSLLRLGLRCIIDEISYQLNPSVYVVIGGFCYATLIKIYIHLIAFDRLVYRIELIVLKLMTSNKTRAPELIMITIVPQLSKCLKFEAVQGGLN